MRVLHLISSTGFFGAENVLIQLAIELQYTDFHPIVGVFKNMQNPHLEVAEEAKRHDLEAVIFPCHDKFDPNAIIRLRKFLNRNHINIIHTHGYKSNLYALAASSGKKTPLITTCHPWLGNDLKMKFYAGLDKFFLNRFNKVVAINDLIKQEILNHNVHPDKVVTIYNGINPDRFNKLAKSNNIRKELGIKEGCRVIGTVGRLTEEKGHIYLLQAAKRILQQYPKVIFLIVGDGPLREQLEAKSTESVGFESVKSCCSKSAVIFKGIRTDIPEIYSIMDIFVLPSLTEGLPMVLLEAMASKKPVIATSVGAIPKVVVDGETGLLINSADSNQLADAIIYLLKNENKAREIGEKGYERVKNEFSSNRMTKQYIKVYEEILKTQQTQ